MKKINQIQLNDVKVLSREVSNTSVTLEVGDVVKVIGIGDRGYDLEHLESGEQVFECRWNCFE